MVPDPEPGDDSKSWIVSELPVLDSCHGGIVNVAPVMFPVVEFTCPAIDAGVGRAPGVLP